MSAIVIYESVYGNTHAVAEAIAEGIGDADVLSVGEAVWRDEVCDLLIVGGPTHIHGMATHHTRQFAVRAAREDKNPHHLDESATEEPDLRTWLNDLPSCPGRKAAAFDTRMGKAPWITGSAARGIARRLDRHGLEVISTQSFLVEGGEGPLLAGELERARAWGKELRKAQSAPPAGAVKS